MKVSMQGLSKAQVLQALYNASSPQGMGFLNPNSSIGMDLERAEGIIKHRNQRNDLYLDYLDGRVLKVDLSGEEFDAYLYDRDNGEGAAQQAINLIPRATGCCDCRYIWETNQPTEGMKCPDCGSDKITRIIPDPE